MASKQADGLRTLYQGWGAALSGGMPLDEWRDLIERWEVGTAQTRPRRCRRVGHGNLTIASRLRRASTWP